MYTYVRIYIHTVYIRNNCTCEPKVYDKHVPLIHIYVSVPLL